MAQVVHIGTEVTLALLNAGDYDNGDIAYIWLNDYTRKMILDKTSSKATDIVNHPYYIRDAGNAATWIEDVGADQPQAWSANQIITGQLTSTNWATDAGSQFDLDSGKLEIRQSGGGITIEQGGDILLSGGSSGDPSLIRIQDGTVPGEIRFEQAGDANYYWSIAKAITNNGLHIGPSSDLSGESNRLYLGQSVDGYRPNYIAMQSNASINIVSYEASYGYIALYVINGSTVTIGVNNVSINDTLTIQQLETDGTQPVVTMEQKDISEEFIKFTGTAASATLTQSIVAEADVTTATRAGFLKISVQDDGNQIADQAYFIPIYTLA